MSDDSVDVEEEVSEAPPEGEGADDEAASEPPEDAVEHEAPAEGEDPSESEEPPESEEPAARFSFVRELGRGVLGEAHEVIDEVTGEPVVLKIFVRAHPSRPEAFKLEFEALSRLKHPSLVRFHHLVDPASDTNISVESVVGETGLAFTQDYVDGVDLEQWLKAPITDEERAALEARRAPATGEVPRDPISGDLLELETTELDDISSGEVDREDDVEHEDIELTPQAIAYAETLEMKRDDDPEEIIAQLAKPPEPPSMDLKLLRLERLLPPIVEGLRHLHKFQKVHGALRPANILVDRSGHALLTDYGIVPELVFRKPGGGETAEVSFLEAPENIPYVAPEAMEVGASPSADLYALGCVLFEAIAETSAFDALEWSGGKSPTLKPPPLAELVPECPASWAEVVDGLLDRDPTHRPSLGAVLEVIGAKAAKAVSVPPTVVAAPDAFIGRDKEMEALQELAHLSASESRVTLALLEGETGAGKSTLLRAIAHHLARRGWLVIQDRCFQRESVVYQGWHQVASTIAKMTESLPLAVREEIEDDILAASRLFPIIGGGRESTGEFSRFRAIRGLRRLLQRLSEERPILLCLEDLHWASWDAASLLVDLFADDAGIRMLTIATWGTDAVGARDHLLQRDLSMALIDVVRFPIRGFGKEEAREYVVTAGSHLAVDDLRTVLKTANLNPRLLDELIAETDETRNAATEVAKRERDANTHAVLRKIYEHRLAGRDKVELATTNLLGIASGPLSKKLLARALETEVGANAMSGERGITEVLARLVDAGLLQTFVPSGSEEPLWTIGHDIVREVVLANLSEREQARFAGRIADALGVHDAKNLDLRFEYELRAGRVGRAMENAVDAARRAEARFAHHRAAKLWRWLVEHRSELPAYTRFEPADELARVELLAGRHDEAARLFREQAEKAKGAVEKAQIRFMEARAWLQAGEVDPAVEALAEGLRLTGARYRRGVWEGMRDAPSILRAVISRWTPAAKEKLATDTKARYLLRGEMAFFATVHATMLDTTRRDHMGAILANAAERTGDPRLLGMERIVLANYRWRSFEEGRITMCSDWLDEADRFFLHAEEHGWRAQVAAERASLQLRHDDALGAERSLAQAFDVGHRAERDGFDRRFALYVEAQHAIRVGSLHAADNIARRCLHVYRGDAIAESRAYEILARAALLRGDVERAAAFIDNGRSRLKASTKNLDAIRWARLSAQLDIALGRPEVAVRQIELLEESLRHSELIRIRAVSTYLKVAMGQALAANAERQRTLGDPRADDSLRALKDVRRDLERVAKNLVPVERAEVMRLFARIELLRDRTKRALRDLEEGAEAIAETDAPIDMAKATEARGHVLLRREQPDARSVMEQAWELYEEHGCSFPLILEGWPIPAQISALREDA